MLLVIDVGNTNTVLGIFAGSELRAHWRLTTSRAQTADEYGLLIRTLFGLEHVQPQQVTGIIIASVVPPLNGLLEEMAEKYFKMKALFLGPGTRTGVAIHYDNPQEVGADRIADAVGAFEKYGGPCVIVDFGTAITFDAISEKGDYLGGVISPGLGIAAEALFARAARLPRVDIREPERVIGTNTVASMQSGLFYGAVGLVDGILDRLVEVLGPGTRVIATGGQAPLIASASRYKPPVDSRLTLDGLRIIYERNQVAAAPASGSEVPVKHSKPVVRSGPGPATAKRRL
ncbi:MAG TPA: type III pantothenate kinase [Terriglobia bacterium]|nr:type III pantothenate kinase [Terriglobia bacterium]